MTARKSISRVNAALQWRVGRSGERGTLAFAHRNKGGEEPPTTSHTTLPHIYTHTQSWSFAPSRSAGRDRSSCSLSLPLSFSLFLETDDRAARSPRLTGRSASCGITRDDRSDHFRSREKSPNGIRGYHSLEFAPVLFGDSSWGGEMERPMRHSRLATRQ